MIISFLLQTLGIVHVLTGPDHLSAIATLSANVNNTKGMAFWLGVRWGIGHSTGLIAVGIVFIILSISNGDDENSDAVIDIPENVSNFFEGLVGIFMLALGAYGMNRAWKKRPVRTVFSNTDNSLFEDPMVPPAQTSGGAAQNEMGQFSSYHDDANHNDDNGENDKITDAEDARQESEWQDEPSSPLSLEQDEGSSHPPADEQRTPTRYQRCCSMSRSTKMLALGAGIVHGLAGPGGVLGVIPAVQLHDAKLATIYLSFFCLSSTLTMGLFAALYGSCSTRLAGRRRSHGNNEDDSSGDGENENVLEVHTSDTPYATSYREFWIECISASFSIIVGMLWLVLLSLGKLDEVFP